MSDFLSREADILGGDFSASVDAHNGDDLDFERAASAFPDISFDGTGDFDVPAPAPPAAARANSGFSFEDFGSPPRETQSAIKVTGDDEMDRFENEFPDIDVGQVSCDWGRNYSSSQRYCWSWQLIALYNFLSMKFRPWNDSLTAHTEPLAASVLL